MIEKNLICPSCGQIVFCQVPDYATEEELNAIALITCDCPEGRTAKRLKEQADEAKLNIEDLCHSNDEIFEPVEDESIITFLYNTVDLIAEKKISKVSVNLVGNSKIQISLGGKDQINVKRTLNVSAQLEAKSRL